MPPNGASYFVVLLESKVVVELAGHELAGDDGGDGAERSVADWSSWTMFCLACLDNLRDLVQDAWGAVDYSLLGCHKG